MPAATTGTPSRAASRWRLWPGWAGNSPVSENCRVRPSRSGSEEQRLSTQSRAAGRISRTSAPASCCKLSPVAADTPGATAATGRMPCTGTACCPIVTKIFCTVRGPRASEVTRRFPTPSTSTGPAGGSRACSSAAAGSMTASSRSSSRLTRGTSSVTYRPQGRSSPSRAISTRVTVTPPRLAVATRTPVGGALPGARNSSSARSVSRMIHPAFPSEICIWGRFGPVLQFQYGILKTFLNKNRKKACAGTANMVS